MDFSNGCIKSASFYMMVKAIFAAVCVLQAGLAARDNTVRLYEIGDRALFEVFFDEIREYCEQMNTRGLIRSQVAYGQRQWPRSEKNQVILSEETAIDLGHPRQESLAFMMWTQSLNKVNDGRITLIGPDLNEIKAGQAPFGKITLLGCHGFNEDNAYDRYIELDMIRYKLKLEDYMLRASPQNMREWSRVGKNGLADGLSFEILGSELIYEYRRLEYVDSAEIIFITSAPEDIARLKPLGEKVSRITEAMNKIFDDLELDCDNCDFNDICDELGALKAMHQKSNGAK